MTDREMLEFAAMAAGIELRWHPDGTAYSDTRCSGYWGVWNPLTDDGDALRLAVKLGIEIIPDLQVNEVLTAFMVGSYGYNTAEEIGTDPLAATRRAIVRAAAEIGRQMP